MHQIKPFDVQTVPLSGSNLIEASAGTGKTYSIAILVLRALLEKEISIREILMVTFTKAAVAELEDRIRILIRQAFQYSDGGEVFDPVIQTIIDRTGPEKAKNLLQTATLNLGETSILTIHSFCQQCLNEFAFETRQLFRAELVQDTAIILEGEVQKFWRKHITGIRPDLLSVLIAQGLSIQNIVQIVGNHLSGKSYISYQPDKQYQLEEDTLETYYQEIQSANEVISEANDELISYVNEHKADLTRQGEKNKYVHANLLSFLTNADTSVFIREIKKKSDLKNVCTTYPEIINRLKRIDDLQARKAESGISCLDYLHAFAIQEIAKGFMAHKTLSNQLSFDDLISNLHNALVGRNNPSLERALHNKYKAVFIDEFQDTDRLQYEIFYTAFQKNDSATTIFFIGDPKQSIFTFRKADIATYLKARSRVDHLYSMNVNYRSTEKMVEAANHFFAPQEGFDAFHNQDADPVNRIDYIRVKAYGKNLKEDLIITGQACIPITITDCKKQDHVYESVASQALFLLRGKENFFQNITTGEVRKIKPADIGILVRTNREGAAIKKALSRKGIPSITLSDTRILQSDEAQDLVYILESFAENSRSNVNRALMTSFTHWSAEEILRLDEEAIIEKFRNYRRRWQIHGVYAAMMDFISDFNIPDKLLNSHSGNGERIVTNLYHLTEILYKTAIRQHLSPEELINWLKRSIYQNEVAGDEFEQRIESDEEAVRISSIHKSKGLEYNITILPTLDFQPDLRDIVSYRNEQTGEYITARLRQMNDHDLAAYQKQDEQENRRLLYVAVTRSVHQCIIFHNQSKKTSTLTTFTGNLDYPDLKKLIEQREPLESDKDFYVASSPTERFIRRAEHFRLTENNWTRMSYSSLAAKNEIPARERFQKSDDEYDTFIFNELPKGARTGNFLHFIFENLHFSNPDSWSYIIDKAVKQFSPNATEEFKNNIGILLDHVMNTILEAGQTAFHLSDINRREVLHELEFDFPVSLFSPKKLEGLMDSGILTDNHVWQQMEGIMNGKVDLFFRHDGRYYVLDWKSNYLGPNLRDYDAEELAEAMDAHNYHLQYLIYTLAVKKYLQSRLGNNFHFEHDFGGVFYLFLRGVRKGKKSGIFYQKPSPEQIALIEEILD